MCKTNESKLDSFFQTMLDELNGVPQSNARDRLKDRMRKRAEYIRPDLEDKCLNEFVALNSHLNSLEITLDKQLVADAKYFITVIFERFNARLSDSNIQETLDMSYLMSLWRFGPGSSNGIKGTHVAEKINQKMTCTSSCEPLVAQIRSTTPYFQSFDAKNDGGTILYKGSRLTTVPKNEQTVRIIAIEPSGNMALQLAAGQYITDVLRSIGLDIRTQQELNKLLAKRGSIDNSLATIDLKSASDMFKPELIRLLMPENWYELLMKIRSPVTEIRHEFITLNMMSTMGNGFTFPLMTLCLVALIYGFRAQRGGPSLFIDWTNTAVFGDDIIIPSCEYQGFTTVLREAGLVVNHDKSYSDGPFRESCGGDYNNGVDITPFYVRSLASDADVYVAINQVLEWSAKHTFLPKTLLYLKTLLNEPLFVPEWHNTCEGILTTQVERRYKYLSVVQDYKRLSDDNPFLMPLAVGGYLVAQGPHACYLPRQYKTRHKVRRGRLPKGFLSGRTSENFRSSTTSSAIDRFVWLVFSC